VRVHSRSVANLDLALCRVKSMHSIQDDASSEHRQSRPVRANFATISIRLRNTSHEAKILIPHLHDVISRFDVVLLTQEAFDTKSPVHWCAVVFEGLPETLLVSHGSLRLLLHSGAINGGSGTMSAIPADSGLCGILYRGLRLNIYGQSQ
jgi:hypothetical protein